MLRLRPRFIAASLCALLTLRSLPSLAMQPLQVFVASAREHNPDVLGAQANVSQQEAQADVALARVLPGISVRGAYTRNQYSAQLDLSALAALGGVPRTVVLLPADQWNGSATLAAPLLDLANFLRTAAARTSAQGSARQLDATRLQIEAQVVQNYHQVIANLALVAASLDALEVSRAGLRLAEEQHRAGTAPVLDVDRARAEVEQRVQQVASAQLQVAIASRALRSSSGVEPDLSAVVQLEDDLHPEPELSVFESGLARLPAVAAAALNTHAAEQQALAQRLILVPSFAGQFTEFGTNAPGFVGHDWSYQASLMFTWSLDLTTFANVRGQDAAAELARARELRTRLIAADAIHQQWNTVVAGIARSRSARAGRESADHAAALAQERYRVGTITQLDLLQAQRDAFSAKVSQIQADADLVNARVQLRVASGHSLLATKERNTRP